MNHLMAKTKGETGGFLKILSDKIIFAKPDDLKNSKSYEPNYKLEDDEWFMIKEFTSQKYCIDFLKENFVSAEYKQIKVREYVNVEYLCSVNIDEYYFQKISSRQFVKEKWFSISKTPALTKNTHIIIINNLPDAIFIKKTDTLYFKKLSTMSTIFKGIEILFREATDAETKTFLNSSFIKLEDDYNVDSVKSANRKRIAMAIETLNKYSDTVKKSVFAYIQEYCKNVKFIDNSFKISNDEELKQILFGIEQRYYTTLYGNEKRLANSITRLELTA